MLQDIKNSVAKHAYIYDDDDSDEGQPLDVETGIPRRTRRSKRFGFSKMFQTLSRRLHYRYKIQPCSLFLASLVLGIFILFLILVYDHLLGPNLSFQIQETTLHVYPYRSLHNLVMVAGHAVYTNSCGKADGEASWFLESYQKHRGQAISFVAHIKAGVQLTSMDENALLLFSGGETRKDAGPRSEAQSYWTVAESSNWFGKRQDVRWRALTEEHARDSFENLLFSICRFRELTGKYPHNITVVSYDFKEFRFANLHRLALGFPASRFFYKGTPASLASAAAASKGEAHVQEQFEKDPYGCGTSLHTKKLARDPFARVIPYPSGCSEIQGLFSYCGTSLYAGKLPWVV